jgi:D-alanine-D-alanine ligase
MSNTVILFGGSSSERLVSVASAQNVSGSLPEAATWFLGPDGTVTVTTREALAAHTDPFTRAFLPQSEPRWNGLAACLDAAAGQDLAFFIALHGGEGEDGTVQRQFEARGLAFTGSGSAASALAFDKARAKQAAGAKGAALAEARTLEPMTRPEAERTVRELLQTHPRWVLKPRADGSSHGLFHLRGPEDAAAASELLARLALPYLAEVFVEGRELTVGVVDEPEGAVALPVSEVRLAKDGAFDYEGKYLGRGTQEITPAELTVPEREQAQALAVLTHRAVGCEGYSRTDMILGASGPVLLEINTLPGLTRASFIPQQLGAAGRELGAFLLGQLELGRARARAR